MLKPPDYEAFVSSTKVSGSRLSCNWFVSGFVHFFYLYVSHFLTPLQLKFGSWTSHGDQISLGLFNGQKKVEHLNFYTENKEWIILNTTVA